MDTPITMTLIFNILELIVALVAGGVAIKAIIKWITSIHDRNQKIDGYDQIITDVKTSIQELRTDSGAKMQQIQAEQCLMAESMLAVLEGLHQLNCNGPVTEARDKLVTHLNERAHQQELK